MHLHLEGVNEENAHAFKRVNKRGNNSIILVLQDMFIHVYMLVYNCVEKYILYIMIIK